MSKRGDVFILNRVI